MKKTIKKLTAVGLTLTSVVGLVACNKSGNDTGKDNENKTITKPTKISIMVDGTVVSEDNGAAEYETYLEGLLEKYGDEGKIDLVFTRPPHSGYYDAVANAFNGSDKPDVVLLSSDYLALYATNDMLWDMTDAWDKSATKASGRLISVADKVMNANMVMGADGEKHLYGFSPYRGNGCCTYVKAAWIKNAGLKVEDVKGKTMSFNDYYDLLKKLKASTASSYVISGPGFISKEAPYTNYLPEFYQKANFTFCLDSSGKSYIDGFSQQNMKDALARIATAVKDGIIDKATLDNDTSAARNKFYSTDPTTESGVFTYWAGTWADTLKTNLESRKLDGELVAINPISELGKYVERLSPAWCITKGATNPEGIFKYFIDSMLDGGDIQTAWEYGAKGTHWDTKAETVTLKDDAGKNTKTYEEGVFHFLPSPEKPNTLMKKNHIDPVLALATFGDKTDPGLKAMAEVARENSEFFNANSEVAIPLPMTDVLGEKSGDIDQCRREVITKVCLGEWSVDEGMKYYKDTVGSQVEDVLKSLNALLK